jgi:hypothetical protein
MLGFQRLETTMKPDDRAAHMREWRKENPEKVKESNRAYYLRNAEKIKAKAREDRAANREKEREKSQRARERRTPEQQAAAKQRQHEWYLRNKERANAANNAWGKANRAKTYEYVKAWAKRHPLRFMYQKSKSSAKYRGLEFTITLDDIKWVTHCPIFGVELCYDRDKKQPHRDDYPTLDRWDNSKGYVPGNVFVISWHANRMKWHATIKQLEAILAYMKVKPSLDDVPTLTIS